MQKRALFCPIFLSKKPNTNYMKLKSILLSALTTVLFCAGANAQVDYYVKHGEDVTVNHALHYPIMVE